MTSSLAAFVVLSCCLQSGSKPLTQQVEHHYADNGGVKLHYVSLGEKKNQRPLVVMLHGFPDFWYTWRNQMPELAGDHYVVAMDLRGYNKSDKPKGLGQYSMKLLMADVIAVIKHAGYEKGTIVGNDWGGAISWNVASYFPQHVERLIICNLPHMNGLRRELANNPQQQKNSSYAREFQKKDAHKNLSVEMLTQIVAGRRSKEVQAAYREAFDRSDFEAMLNYYKANFPTPGKQSESAPPMPNVKCPTMIIHGLKDKALLASGLNDNWDWIDNEVTILTLPKADHFVQQDAPDRVTRAMLQWLSLGGAKSRVAVQRQLGEIADELSGHVQVSMGYPRNASVLGREQTAVSWRASMARFMSTPACKRIYADLNVLIDPFKGKNKGVLRKMPPVFSFPGSGRNMSTLVMPNAPGTIGQPNPASPKPKPKQWSYRQAISWEHNQIPDKKGTLVAFLVREEFRENWQHPSPKHTIEELYKMLPTNTARLAITANFSVVELPEDLTLADFRALLTIDAGDKTPPLKVLSKHGF